MLYLRHNKLPMKNILYLMMLSVVFFSCQDRSTSEAEENNTVNTSSDPMNPYLVSIHNTKSEIIVTSSLLNQTPQDTADFIRNDSLFRRIGELSDYLNELVVEAYGKVNTDSLLKTFDGFIPREVYEQMTEAELSTELGQKLQRSRVQFEQMSAQLKTIEGKSICDESSEVAMQICERLEGRTLIIFSASWCAPCLQLESKFEKLVKYRGEHILEVDIQDHPVAHYAHDLLSQGSWERFYDESLFWGRFGIPGVPFVIIVDEDGIVQHAMNPEEVEFLVKEMDSEKYP